MSEPWLVDWSVSTGPVDTAGTGELAALFDVARERAVASARRRLAAQLPFAVAELTADELEPSAGPINGPPLLTGDPILAVEQAIRLAWGPGRRRARLATSESIAVIDAGDHDSPASIDPRDPAQLATLLDGGWMVEVPDLIETSPALARLVADIETVCDGETDSVGWFGVRSALGPPPDLLATRRLLIQLVGSRQVMIRRPGAENAQLKMRARTAVLIPANVAASHLPLDVDTLHLEITIPEPGADEVVPRWERRARVATSFPAARAVVAADPISGYPFRWAAPGGVAVVDERDEPSSSVELVTGGRRLVVARQAVPKLARIAEGEWIAAAELVEGDDDPRPAAAFLEALWRLGLLEPAPNGRDRHGRSAPERLAKVGHANTLNREQCASLIANAAGWRPAAEAEIHVPAGLEDRFDVCELEADFDGFPLIQHALAHVNSEVFRFEVEGLEPGDPLVIVRQRAGPGRQELTVDDYRPDVGGSHPGRKLTFVIPLDGQDGAAGRVRLAGGSDTVTSTAGRVSVFASFRSWVLEPLPEGERHLMIGRVHGPSFV